MRIGVIAEEASDIDVLYELTCKLTKENMFSFKRFIGHGCGKLRKNAQHGPRICFDVVAHILLLFMILMTTTKQSSMLN